MTSTALALTWRRQAVQPVDRPPCPDPKRVHQDMTLLDWRSPLTRTSEADPPKSEGSERSEPVTDTDAEAVEERLVGVELLRELPEGYDLHFPIPLNVYRAPYYYYVTMGEGFLHGIGDSPEEAVEEYGQGLLDYYLTLRREREILAPHLRTHLEQLEEIITEK